MRLPLAAPLATAALLALCGCEPMITSDAPLFEAGGPGPKEGLWALLDGECATPTTSDVTRWPECADALRIGQDEWSLPRAAPPMGGRFLIAAGRPLIVQLAPPASAAGPGEQGGYAYAAFEPEGPAPYTRGRLQGGLCPPRESPGAAGLAFGEEGCVARTPEAVRAGLAAADGPWLRAVWIAP